MYISLLGTQVLLALYCVWVGAKKMVQTARLARYDLELFAEAWSSLSDTDKAAALQEMKPSWCKSLFTGAMHHELAMARLDREHEMAEGISTLRVLSRVGLLIGVLGAAAINLGLLRSQSLANLSSVGVSDEAARRMMWVLSLGVVTSLYTLSIRWQLVRRLRQERKVYEEVGDRLELAEV